jgi:hypothetical protein
MLKFVAALAISAVASLAHSQQILDYNGNNMTGDSSDNINAQFQISGKTVNYDVEVFGKTIMMRFSPIRLWASPAWRRRIALLASPE